ncbi:MAG: sigma-54-dependent Fis family transcriptional regulator, partial [Deltaproteobacteria bacterium]|nr:sigma-54-dependent Fis family transcriptional regulator [Deltaproteobacteria bacterium]
TSFEFAVQMPYVALERAGSVQQMAARHVTHVVAFPLVAPGDVLVGMLAIELSWPEASGRAAIPRGAWVEQIELACVATAAHLTVLPRARKVTSAARDPLLPVVGAKMSALVEALRVFAGQGETILLTGPTGSGKTQLARWCHAQSTREDGPFHTANLLAVEDGMQMADLFGWRKGAFTGASSDYDGLVAEAHGGTLFLDEIDKLSLKAQAGLLRFLETRRYTPLGGTRDREANVRFLVGTNADLRELVARGAFREDLYYRIHVLPVQLPPLSERTDEIPDWVRVFLARRHLESSRVHGASITDDAIALLTRARWPGNLRQVDNVVRRSYAFALVRAGGERGAPSLGLDDVTRALSLEGASLDGSSSPHDADLDGLDAIARAVVDTAIERRRRGEIVDLATLEGLVGGVLREASERLGSVKNAYLLFGASTLVENRNHTKSYKRELEKWDALRALASRSKDRDDDDAP